MKLPGADIIERNTAARFVNRDVFHAHNCSEVSGEVKLEPRTKRNGCHAIKVYPNPFQQYITVDLGGMSGGAVSMCIYDVTGKLIKTVTWKNKTYGQIDISGMHSGVYVLKVDGDGLHETIRLMKIN
ncbi:MAG: T9SS type A sorting domain-containing protein [Lewinellaceae bacterium]|nr:T9SS type A sorting domain-containing protein [Lewinellaceae bacterium]